MKVMDLLAQARPASLDPQPDAARRASDLAAAIATPRPGQQRPRDPTHPRRRIAWPTQPGRRIAAGAGLAALAGAAAAAVALAYAVAPAAQHPQAAPGTSETLRTAILTAFNGVSGDIYYSQITESWPHGSSVTDMWTYPQRPNLGQWVRQRIYLVHASNASRFNMELIYQQASNPENSQGAIQISTQRVKTIDVEYGNRTWSETTQGVETTTTALGPSTLRQEIASGTFTSVMKTELGGRAVVKLTIRESVNGTAEVSTMWVDAVTYLPLRVVSEIGGYTYESESAYLPPTAANLAKLNVTVPAGFTRTPTIEAPKG